MPGGYILPYYDQNAPILMATQGTAMRNGTPMRLVSPAPMLVQPQASRQTPAGGSLYSSAAPQGLYGTNVNTTVNGGTLSGKFSTPLFFFLFWDGCGRSVNK